MSRLENLLGAQSLALADRLLAESGDSPGAGPSRSEAAALVTLLAHAGRTMNWLGAVLGLTSSGVTRLVERLVAAGWVTRSAGQDARRRQLTLTPAGTQRAEAILAGRQAALSAVLGRLSAGEQVALEGLLNKVVTGLADDRLTALRVCRLCDRAACSEAGQRCPLEHAGSDDDR